MFARVSFIHGRGFLGASHAEACCGCSLVGGHFFVGDAGRRLLAPSTLLGWRVGISRLGLGWLPRLWLWRWLGRLLSPVLSRLGLRRLGIHWLWQSVLRRGLSDIQLLL